MARVLRLRKRGVGDVCCASLLTHPVCPPSIISYGTAFFSLCGPDLGVIELLWSIVLLVGALEVHVVSQPSVGTPIRCGGMTTL